MKTFDFTWQDEEGDEYQSNGHISLRDAKHEWDNIKESYPDARLVETWIYEDGEFVGRW